MAYDELQRLLGTTNTPTETITASGNGTGVFLGKNRLFIGELRVAGAVSGTSPTLDVKLQEATTVGGSYTDIPGAAFTQRTASDIVNQGSDSGAGPLRIGFRTSKDYVRAVKTIGGSATPTFNGVSCLIVNPNGVAGF